MSREMAKATAPRRIFKPTIPTTRRSTQRSGNGVTAGVNGVGGRDGGWDSSSSDQNNCCNSKVKGKQKSNKPRGKKEFIQLDATFNGINKIPAPVKVEKALIGPGVSGYGHSNDTLSSQTNSPKGFGSTSLTNGSSSVKVKSDDEPSSYGNSFKTMQIVDHHHQGKEVIKGEETEEDVETIQRALYRDDFVSLFDPNEEGMTPIGWECVSQHQAFKQEKSKRECKPSSIRFDKWASTSNDQDKMVLFQLPEMLLNSGDGHVGKIRMYQSGKMELIDTRTGVVHDLLHTDRQVNHHPDDDDDGDADDETDNNSDEDNNSEDNNQLKGSTSIESNFSTDWIKKEDEDDQMNHNRNYDSLPPPPQPLPPTFSTPSTSYLSSMQSPSSSKLNHNSSTSTKSSKSSKSKSSSKNLKANNHKLNRRTHCDKDEESDDDDDDDDEATYREACTFDGDKVVCLGPISNNQLLIGRPRLDKFINL